MGIETGALQINFTPHPITSSLRSAAAGALEPAGSFRVVLSPLTSWTDRRCAS
jgi:hypothetical protein